MANRNGMGPFNKGPLTGGGRGNCLQTSAKIGLGIGMGLAWGCRHGIGKQGFRVPNFTCSGRRNNAIFQNNQESMVEYKKHLEEELELINSQISSKDNEQ